MSLPWPVAGGGTTADGQLIPAPTARIMLLATEGAEPMLRPTLEVSYLEATPASTCHSPYTASRMIPGDLYTIPVTVSNPTLTAWSAADWELSYHWLLPDDLTEVSNPGNQLFTPLPKTIVPGDTVDISAQLKTPIQSDSGNKRTDYLLKWELHNKTTGQWLSQVAGIAPLSQNVAVEDPTSDQLGMEKFSSTAKPITPRTSNCHAQANTATTPPVSSGRARYAHMGRVAQHAHSSARE